MTAAIAGQLSLYDLLGPPPEPPGAGGSDQAGPGLGIGERQAATEQPAESALDSAAEAGSAPPLAVRVTRSARRKKTAQAQLVESVLEIRIPAACTAADERYFVDHFRQKFERARAASLVDLEARAEALAAAYDLPRPRSIRWVSNQKQQWGSCTPSDGSIRLSDRMAGFPRWVIDYVIVHELAHLVEIDHGPAFWALVDAYPKTERARGYLLAKDGV